MPRAKPEAEKMLIKQLLSSTPIIYLSGAQKMETIGENETIGFGLKQLEEIGDFLQIVSISTVKMKKME